MSIVESSVAIQRSSNYDIRTRDFDPSTRVDGSISYDVLNVGNVGRAGPISLNGNFNVCEIGQVEWL
jgi:hypothetical protein